MEVQKVAVEQAEATLAREEVLGALHTVVAPKDSTVLQVKCGRASSCRRPFYQRH